MDIVLWLRSLGLGKYEAAFRENEIDETVLPSLTEEHLKQLGVTALGHRVKLLDAIAALRSDASGKTPAVDAATASSTASAHPEDRAERRQVTVMFSDLVGSTALSARMDPEDLREVISAYQKCVAETMQRFGGFVAKYMGDGVLIYFGYPQAHEDDAERAVRAGLTLVQRVPRLATNETLAIRVGIASGLVVVGDLIGRGEAQERGVVGETPNLAARLQAVAPPGGVLIAEATRRLVGDLFDYEDLGATDLKGFAASVPVWQVLRPSQLESRFEALRASAMTPLVGREEELDLLLRRWRRAAAGEGQVVLLAGEAGIGKSRLTAALRERLEEEPHTRLRYFCSPNHQDSALHPFIAQLERAAGFTHDDGPETRLDKMEALLAPVAPSPEELALLAELLSLPSTERYPVLQLTPQRKRERTFAALLRQLEAFARRQPVLMVFEDLHWIDPSSRELLDLLIERVARLPGLLILTFRPEFAAPWNGLPQVTVLILNRLDSRIGTAMVVRIAGNRKLSDGLAAEIVERADGVPLFVEELTRAVIEAGTGGDDALAGATPQASSGVPPALYASLMARLDRLGPTAREIAQIGAVIGRDFPYELLAPIADPRSDAQLADALDRLTDAGLVFRRGALLEQATFQFKHALVRDVAYASLLRRRRQDLHAQVAAQLETSFTGIADAQPELLAHHFTEAGRSDQAIAYWQRAGERATARSGNLEAIAHLRRGIEMLNTLPESGQRDERELALQVAVMAPLMATRGMASDDLERVVTRALALCRQAGADAATRSRAMLTAGWVYLTRGELATAREQVEQLLGLAERLQDPELLAHAHFAMGDTLLWFGELEPARRHLERALALDDPLWSHPAGLRFGFNCAALSYFFLGRVLWHLGYPDQALSSSNQAVAIAEEASHAWSHAGALSWLAALHQLRVEVEQTRQAADAAFALANQQAIVFFDAHAMVLRGWALVKGGEQAEGIAELRKGLAAYRATGGAVESPHWLALFGEACRDIGQIDDGLRVVEEALVYVARTGVVYHQAELHRLDGELRLARDPADAPAAEACFCRALAVARQQQAKSWELRAAMSLARLWRDQGKVQQARELLAPVYGWFREGFDTRDLKEAKALLEELVA